MAVLILVALFLVFRNFLGLRLNGRFYVLMRDNALFEFLNTSGGVNYFFVARVEGVTSRTYFHVYFRHSRRHLIGCPASASCFCLGIIFWMNLLFHVTNSNKLLVVLQYIDLLLIFGGYGHNIVAIERISNQQSFYTPFKKSILVWIVSAFCKT